MEREQTALRRSIGATAILGAIGVVWGVVSGSQVILLDGVFSVIGIGTSWMLLRASSLAVAGPSRSYPFGREAVIPMVVGIQGIVLGATLLYAAAEGAFTILRGGSMVDPASAMAYAVLVTLAGAAVWLWLRSSAAESEVVAAEVVAWRLSVLRGVGMLIGFGVLIALSGSALGHLGPYVDPVLVLVTCALLIGAPIRMIRSTVFELLEGTPPVAVQRPIEDAVAAIAGRHGIGQPELRATKLGRKVYVEVAASAAPTVTIAEEHRMRDELRDGLEPLPYRLWLNFELQPDSRSSGGGER